VYALRTQHHIKTLCRVLKVNRSTYYKHFSQIKSPRTLENEEIKCSILELYAIHDKRLGVIKTRELLRGYGINISANRVYRLMKSMLLPAMSTRKPRFTYASHDDFACINQLNQQFKQKSPNTVWVSDITYIRVSNYWCYLCVIIDLFSRKIIAYKIAKNATANLVIDTFKLASKSRNLTAGLMFHSDRGTQYTSALFRKLLDEKNVVQSFSKKGHPYDNAVAEAFFKYLKLEQTNRRSYTNINELELSIFEYINYYNSKRPHSSNNYLTPNAMEDNYYKS